MIGYGSNLVSIDEIINFRNVVYKKKYYSAFLKKDILHLQQLA